MAHTGTLVRDLGWAILYLDETSKDTYYGYVRICGQWMFSQYMGGSREKIGKVILELNANSADCLTSNRDALKGDYRTEFSELLEEIVTDTQAALDAKNPTVRKKYEGTGKVKVLLKQIKEHVRAAIEAATGMGLDQVTQIPESSRKELVNQLLNDLPMENVTPTIARSIAKEISRLDFKFTPERLAFLGYEPDFVTIYEQKDASRAVRFMATKKAAIIAKAWTSILKQVLLDIEWYGEFTAGFSFRDSTDAEFERNEEGEYFFYLNPEKLLGGFGKDMQKRALSNRRLMREDLLSKAIHEVTHIKREYHNEDFVLSQEHVRERTWLSYNIYPKLITEAFEEV